MVEIQTTPGKAEVVAALDTKLLCEKPILLFRMDFGGDHEYMALLVAERLRAEMGKALAEIRAAAYSAGWQDRAAKRKRKELFAETWHSTVIGY